MIAIIWKLISPFFFTQDKPLAMRLLFILIFARLLSLGAPWQGEKYKKLLPNPTWKWSLSSSVGRVQVSSLMMLIWNRQSNGQARESCESSHSNTENLSLTFHYFYSFISRNMGQVCFAGTRIFVQEGVYDTVIKGLTEAAQTLATQTGDQFAEGTVHGPQISQTQFDVGNPL
jgi:hypothetical protein